MLVEITPALAPAVSLDDLKEFLRILDSDDDTLITSMGGSAEKHTENICNIKLAPAIYEWFEADFISRMPLNPIKSITSIEYMVDGVYTLLDDTTYYTYEKYGVSYIAFTSIPGHDTHMKAVKITFEAGYDTIPNPIASYIKVKVSSLYEGRESFVVGSSISTFDDNLVKNLLLPYQVKPI